MLIGSQLQKCYGAVKALRVDRLEVESGKITAVIGPSGGGKTTLLRILALLDPPDTGTIQVDELSYSFPLGDEVPFEPPWPRVTLVFQNLFLWPHLTLRQNILLPRKLRQANDIEPQFDEIVRQFEMAAFLDRYPNETSGGQRQRAALARALLLQPSYILLDEITSALDVEQVGAMLSYLQSLKLKNIGILMVTHLVNFARRAADQVVFIDQGEVVEAGGSDILDAPKHDRLKRFLSVVEAAR